MKKRLFFISLVLALVMTTLMPVTVFAAKPADFSASGTITGISPGDVFPAGESGRWVVAERELTGTFPDGEDISGDFTLTYKANVELATQAGNLHGELAMNDGSYVLKVNGKIEPLAFAGWYLPPGVDPNYPNGIPLLQLTINGRWTFTDGARGQGDFSASATFVPTPDGHVAFIVASTFDLTGKW